MKKVTPQPIFGRDVPDSVLRLCREYSESLNQLADHRFSEFVQVSGSYTAGENDHVIECSPSGAMTVTLPAASVMRNKRVVVKRANNTTHTITIQSTSGTIDDAASVTLTTAYQSREVFSDGSEWWLLDTVTSGVETDPYWGDVLVSLPMTDDWADLSSYGRTFTAAGGAALSSDYQLFSLDAGKFVTTLDEATTTDVTDLSLGSDDFTVEFWILLPSTNGSFTRRIFQITHSTGYSIQCYVNNANAVGFLGSNGSSQIATLTTAALTVGQWSHVAFGRDGNVVVRALDGTVGSGGGSSFVGTLNSNTVSELQLGNDINNSDLSPKCYLAHFRLTGGVWRYTSNFTPPTAPFPTS